MIAIADAIVPVIVAGPWTNPAPAAGKVLRRLLPVYALTELADLRVTVVPRGDDSERVSRGQFESDLTIDLLVERHTKEAAEQDAVVAFAEELRNHFRKTRVPGIGETCRTANLVAAYLPDNLKDKNVISSVVRLTYHGIQE